MAVLAAFGLQACAPRGAPDVSPAPRARPNISVAFKAPRTDASFALEQYYANVQSGLLVQGLLRDDGGGPDTAFDRETLIRTFKEIVFRQEFVRRGNRLIAARAESTLNRFEAPVTVNIIFGGSVSPDAQDSDRGEIVRLLDRLSAHADHPIFETAFPGNFTVFILHEDDRRALGPELKAVMPELTEDDVTAILDMPRSRYCLVVTSDPANNGQLERAFAIVRAEHPQKLRTSCLHEEIAQGLGLQNDSPNARPSIFTDDEEFGRLTAMDEKLLMMLYDPRLTPGMTVAEAAPVIDQIASEIFPDEEDV